MIAKVPPVSYSSELELMRPFPLPLLTLQRAHHAEWSPEHLWATGPAGAQVFGQDWLEGIEVKSKEAEAAAANVRRLPWSSFICHGTSIGTPTMGGHVGHRQD